jgi:hypothetical protein
MLRNHGPNDAYKNKYPLKAQNNISLTSLPHTQQLHHTQTLYLPGYITQAAVLRVIKDAHTQYKTYCAQILLLKWDVAREYKCN